MPIYSYECLDCKHEQDVLHKYEETPVFSCNSCKGTNHKKKVTAASFKMGHKKQKDFVLGKASEEAYKRAELLGDYGVEKVGNVNGSSFDDVYKDVKEQGSAVRDRLAESKEIETKKAKERQINWKESIKDRAAKKIEKLKKRDSKK